jgi:hypothetical protein
MLPKKVYTSARARSGLKEAISFMDMCMIPMLRWINGDYNDTIAISDTLWLEASFPGHGRSLQSLLCPFLFIRLSIKSNIPG